MRGVNELHYATRSYLVDRPALVFTSRLLAEALHPYPADLLLATKVGGTRGADKSWLPYAQPAEIRRSVENNLRELKLAHFGKTVHSPGDDEAAFGTLLALQPEGKILHLGLSNATVEQFHQASALGKVASVESMYSYTQRVTTPAPAVRTASRGRAAAPMCAVANPLYSVLLPADVAAHRAASDAGASPGQMRHGGAAQYRVATAPVGLDTAHPGHYLHTASEREYKSGEHFTLHRGVSPFRLTCCAPAGAGKPTPARRSCPPINPCA